MIFSAAMVHRGLYGLDRLALDIWVFDTDANLADFVDDDCLADTDMLNDISVLRLFINTLELKTTT